MEKDSITFEEALNNLKEAVSKLENGEISLDEAFGMFEKGIKYARICEDKLTNIEMQVTKIINEGKQEDFKVEE